MKDEIKEILEKLNKEVEKAELTRNPYSNEDKKFKHILVSLSEEHFNIFKDTLDCITNLQKDRDYLDDYNRHLHTELTNLQEENKRLKEELQQEKKDFKEANDYCFELKDYKSRNEKAIKELETLLPLCIMPNNTLIHATEKAKVIEKAINTLQRKSDE